MKLVMRYLHSIVLFIPYQSWRYLFINVESLRMILNSRMEQLRDNAKSLIKRVAAQ